MPTRFLTAEQRRRYGRFPEKLSPDDLARYFHLDEPDQAILRGLRGVSSRIDFALQLGMVRLLGRFPETIADLPARVIRRAVAERPTTKNSALFDVSK